MGDTNIKTLLVMKKSRLLIAVLAMLVTSIGYAQDSYREALKQYLSYFGQYDQMKTALRDINEAFFRQGGNVDLEMLTERYCQEALVDQMLDMTEPMMKERNVTEADLRAVNEMMATPEFQTFLTHQNEWNEKMTRIEAEFLSLIRDGGELEKLQVNPDIDAGYAAKFQKMWKDSGIEEKTMGLFDGLFSDEMSEIGKFKTWLTDNLGTLALNAAYGSLTLEDFDLGMRLFTNGSYRKATDTSGMNLFSVIGPATDVIIKYLDWMESQGAQPNEKFQSFKVLRMMMENGQ